MKKQKDDIWVWFTFVIVVCVVICIVYFLMNKPEKVDPLKGVTNNLTVGQIEINNQQKPNNNSQLLQEQSLNKNMEKISKKGDTLVMNYTGRLTDGTVFDSNIDPQFKHVQPFEFVLGAGQVIAGWDEGLIDMKVGEKRTLTVPPEKGYGSRAVSIIPANSTLIFDVELLEIK